MIVPTSYGRNIIRSEDWSKLKWYRFSWLGIELLLLARAIVNLAVLALFESQ